MARRRRNRNSDAHIISDVKKILDVLAIRFLGTSVSSLILVAIENFFLAELMFASPFFCEPISF